MKKNYKVIYGEKSTEYLKKVYKPFYDIVKNKLFITFNNEVVEFNKRIHTNSIKKVLSEYTSERVSNYDINLLFNSSMSQRYDPIEEYFKDVNIDEPIEHDYINDYADCLINNQFKTEKEQLIFKEWIRVHFKKWMVGNVRNYLIHYEKTYDLSCPLILVLCGSESNKSLKFLTHLIPNKLNDYINIHKDLHSKKLKRGVCENILSVCTDFSDYLKVGTCVFRRFTDMERSEVRSTGNTINYFETIYRRAMVCAIGKYNDMKNYCYADRRIIPILVDDIDIKKLQSIDVDKMFKQAFKLYFNGFDWEVASKEEQAYLETYGNAI